MKYWHSHLKNANPQAASSSPSHSNALGWWRGCAAHYQPQLRALTLGRTQSCHNCPSFSEGWSPQCRQIQTKSLQIKLEEFPFTSEPSRLGSLWSTTTWVYTAHQACSTHTTVPEQPQELGYWGDTGLTAREWALVLLLSMTKSLIKQPGLRAQNWSISYLAQVCVCVLWSCMFSRQCTMWGYSFPPSVSFTHLPFLFLLLSKLPEFLQMHFSLHFVTRPQLLSLHLPALCCCCGLELLMKNRLSKPFSSAACF